MHRRANVQAPLLWPIFSRATMKLWPLLQRSNMVADCRAIQTRHEQLDERPGDVQPRQPGAMKQVLKLTFAHPERMLLSAPLAQTNVRSTGR